MLRLFHRGRTRSVSEVLVRYLHRSLPADHSPFGRNLELLAGAGAFRAHEYQPGLARRPGFSGASLEEFLHYEGRRRKQLLGLNFESHHRSSRFLGGLETDQGTSHTDQVHPVRNDRFRHGLAVQERTGMGVEVPEKEIVAPSRDFAVAYGKLRVLDLDVTPHPADQ